MVSYSSSFSNPPVLAAVVGRASTERLPNHTDVMSHRRKHDGGHGTSVKWGISWASGFLIEANVCLEHLLTDAAPCQMSACSE